jgi:hypothetical protein
MLTISSSPLTPTIHPPILRRRYSPSSSSDLYRPRTIIIEKSTTTASFGFSIQTYGFASLNILPTDESACSLLSLSSSSTTSRKSSTSNSFCSSSQTAPIQLVTYVDHVQDKSPAWEAGLRPGSVILSVNDQTVEHDDHETLVKRITQASQTQLKLIVIQQNINKQIALCEKLQQLHKQLHEKEEELEELSKQEMNSEGDISIKLETNSPSPRLKHTLSFTPPERTSSFCHDKIPPDWRQSVANFAHQQNLTIRTLQPILSSSSSITSSKYTKNRHLNHSQHHQRSMSLSTIVLHYSKPSLFRHRPPLLINHQTSNHRRALSYEELFSSNKINNDNNNLLIPKQDDSMIASGCSLAMDLSKSFDQKNSHLSSSSSTTINTDEDENNHDNKIKQFKWKLRINK